MAMYETTGAATRPGLLHALSLPSVSGAETHHDDDCGTPFPEEQRLVERAVPRRRREFMTVRSCARRALATLGEAPAPILHDRYGAPLWPYGVIGSLTHCTGFRGAVVARREHVAYLGIDAEPNVPLPAGVLAMVATTSERQELAELPTTLDVCWDKLLFSAKEAAYKAAYPVAPHAIDFEATTINIGATGRLAARHRQPKLGAVAEMRGRWLYNDGLLLTTFQAPHTHEPRPPRPLNHPEGTESKVLS